MRSFLRYLLCFSMSYGRHQRHDVLWRRCSLESNAFTSPSHASNTHVPLFLFFLHLHDLRGQIRSQINNNGRHNRPRNSSIPNYSRLFSKINKFSTGPNNHHNFHDFLFIRLRHDLRSSYVDLGIISTTAKLYRLCCYGKLGRSLLGHDFVSDCDTVSAW